MEPMRLGAFPGAERIPSIPPPPSPEADLPPDFSLPLPGQPPYTRGIHPTGYRGKLWTMRQFSGFATPEETNLRYKYLLAQGGNFAGGELAVTWTAQRRVVLTGPAVIVARGEVDPDALRRKTGRDLS